jgi:polyisoprenoid-binding protein YceI
VTKLAFTVAFACLQLAALAESQSFDFKDPNGINKIVVRLDSATVHLSATATNVSGTVTFDPAQPSTVKGRIVVAAGSVHVGPADAQGLPLGAPGSWLDAAKFSEIIFETTAIENLRPSDNTTNQFTADVTGVITLHGVPKKITVPVKIGYLSGRLRERNPQLQGDLLRINANFTLQRGDFESGPASGAAPARASNVIQVNFTISGQCPRQSDGAMP